MIFFFLRSPAGIKLLAAFIPLYYIKLRTKNVPEHLMFWKVKCHTFCAVFYFLVGYWLLVVCGTKYPENIPDLSQDWCGLF